MNTSIGGAMNTYCQSAFNQINVAITTIIKIMDKLEEGDLQKRPSPNKNSIGELLQHIVTICKADFLIANGASQDEMNTFYAKISYKNLSEMKKALLENFRSLEECYFPYSEEDLQQKVTSYWGVTYTKYEWLLEILAHVYHHRGQLHAMLVHCYRKDPDIAMFE